MIRLTNRLDALLYVLKSCCGPTCRDPWSALHGEDTLVKSLADALHPKVDIALAFDVDIVVSFKVGWADILYLPLE